MDVSIFQIIPYMELFVNPTVETGVPVQKSRTFFRQKSVFDGEKEDSIGNSTDLTGNDIDSPEQKKTVPDFFTPFRTYRSQWMDECMPGKHGKKGTPTNRRHPPGFQITMDLGLVPPGCHSFCFSERASPWGDGRGDHLPA